MLLQYKDLRTREYINMADAGGQGQGQSRIDKKVVEAPNSLATSCNIPPSTLSSLAVSLVQVREIPH
jgi:hypothetical protein